MWRTSTIPAGITIACVLAAFAIAAPGDQDSPRCHGKRATITGTAGDDLLWGTTGRDVIWAGPGDDTVHGERGNDLICGGGGSDLVDGGRNNDIVDAGPGDGDRAYGGLGDDQVTGGPGDGDEASGHLGIDLVNGGPGDGDHVHGDYGWDRMDGGPGRADIASFATAPDGGVWVSLPRKKARGDGRDRLYRFEAIEGSPKDDVLIGDRRTRRIEGGAGDDELLGAGDSASLDGGQGTDRCRNAATRASCGRETARRAPVYAEIDPAPGGGGGLAIVGGKRGDRIVVDFDPETARFSLSSEGAIGLGYGCARIDANVKAAYCDPGGPARWLIADLGAGDDRLRIRSDLRKVGQVRITAGKGDDRVLGGPGDELIESGRGADRILGGDGEDALVGGLPGPTVLDGGPEGDLIAAGGGCAGGALIGGGGRDNASFAETQAHPGRLIISLPAGRAWIDAIEDCRPVRIDRSNEDIEGSFDNDVLIGDRRSNSLLGQPGQDIFYGGGGNDTINALDKVEDFVIDCGRPNRRTKRAGTALVDSRDPASSSCRKERGGRSTPGLHHEH